MIIGLDVGGTYTDAVLLDGGEVREKAKILTDPDDLFSSLLTALDALLGRARGELAHLVLSTTLITNLIATKRTAPAALVLIPGPGLNPASFDFGVPTFILSGAIDYRGREIAPLNEEELAACAAAVKESGIKRLAVVGKFSQRNNTHERAVAAYLRRALPDVDLVLGHEVSGRLNFPRRAVTALLTLATRERYEEFFREVERALAGRGVKCPVYILKADGGTIPLPYSLRCPVETIFSGPAASTLGVLALTPPGETSVVVDIGGTTTDLALILSGKPLLASRGARVDGYLTHVRAFATKSVPLGGDSVVRAAEKRVVILPERRGSAYCTGGPEPTPTDAMRVAGLTQLGSAEKAWEAMALLGRELGVGPREAADLVLKEVVRRLKAEIEGMFAAWEEEPAYRIWELLQERKVRPQNIVGIGGAAPAVIPVLGAEMSCRAVVPPYAEVANAIGAALAKVTVRLTVHIDTERGYYSVEETGVQDAFPGGRQASPREAEEFALQLLRKEGAKLGIPPSEEPELVYSEVFNMVRGWTTTGRLYDICVQYPPGIREDLWKGRPV